MRREVQQDEMERGERDSCFPFLHFGAFFDSPSETPGVTIQHSAVLSPYPKTFKSITSTFDDNDHSLSFGYRCHSYTTISTTSSTIWVQIIFRFPFLPSSPSSYSYPLLYSFLPPKSSFHSPSDD